MTEMSQEKKQEVAVDMGNQILEIINSRIEAGGDHNELGQLFLIALSIASGTYLAQIAHPDHIEEVLGDFCANVRTVLYKFLESDSTAKEEPEQGKSLQ